MRASLPRILATSIGLIVLTVAGVTIHREPGSPGVVDAPDSPESAEVRQVGLRPPVLATSPRVTVRSDAEASRPLYRIDDNARALNGRVVARADGAAIAGAVVSFDVMGVLGPEHGSVPTDDRGAFRIAVPGERADLRIHARGYASAVRLGVTPEEALTVRLAPAPRLTGRVVNEQQEPVPGVIVRVLSVAAPVSDTLAEATSDMEGRFLFDQLPLGDVTALARGGGWIPMGAAVRPTLGAGLTTDIELVVIRGVEARGRVLDVDGAPLAGASVWCEADTRDADFAWKGSWPAAHAVTDSDGAFVIASLKPKIRYVFSARAIDGMLARTTESAESAGGPIAVKLRMATPCFLVVTVVAAEQRIEGARVDVSCRWGSDVRSDGRTFTTGPDGQVRVGPLPPQDCEVSAHADGYRQPYAMSSPRPTPEGSNARVGLVRIRRIEGAVLWPDGTPASGARVAIRGLAGDRVFGWGSVAMTRADGTFDAGEFDPHAYRALIVATRDGRPFHLEADVVAGGPKAVLTLISGEPPSAPRPEPMNGFARLRVRVVDPEGRVLPTASVRVGESVALVRDGWADVPYRVGAAVTVEAYDPRDDDGLPMPFGPGWLRVADPPPPEVTVRLVAGQTLSGRLVSPEGDPVRFVGVLARVESGAGPASASPAVHGYVRSDAEGRFRFVGLADGVYMIEPERSTGLFPPRRAVRARAGGTDVVVAYHRGVDVRITVVDGRGLPISDSHVTASAPRWRYASSAVKGNRSRRLSWSSIAECRTDASGVALLSDLDPDEDELSLGVNAPPNRTDLFARHTYPFMPTDRRVVLPDSRGPGTAVPSDDQPVAQSTPSPGKGLSVTGRISAPVAVYEVRVTATGSGPGTTIAGTIYGTIDGDRYELTGLAQGPWTIIVEARDWDRGLWRAEMSARAGETLDILLARASR